MTQYIPPPQRVKPAPPPGDRAAPSAELVAFSQKVEQFAGTLLAHEAEALRRLLAAGLMADDQTIRMAFGEPVSGYAGAGSPFWNDIQLALSRPGPNGIVANRFFSGYGSVALARLERVLNRARSNPGSYGYGSQR